MTLMVFTSVLCLGVLIKAIDVAAKGISVGLIAKIFGLNVPFMLTFSIPISVVTSVLLVFGRMSFDGEITAMKACGVSLWQIVAPILILAILLSAFCLSINTSIAPLCRLHFREMIAEVGNEDPAKLLEPGRFVRDFPGMLIYVSDRKGSDIKDVVVYQLGSNGPVQNIRAEYGRIHSDPTNALMMIDLFNVHSDALMKESGGDSKWHHIDAREYPYSIDLKQILRKRQVHQKVGEMTYGELTKGIRNIAALFPELQPRDLLRQRMTMMVEANKRLSLSMSCFAFALIGIPLGMKSKRRESSMGVLISLMLIFVFYLFIIIANQLVGKPQLRPDLIVWFPAIAYEILGFILIQRTN